MKRFIVIAFFLFGFLNLYGQKSSYEYDTLTLHYYYVGNWDSLIIVGKDALKNDVDFFYLRSRMGYAEFSLGHYRNAVKHFEKAYQLNSFDDFVKYYLFLAYFNAGMKSEANHFGYKLNKIARNELNYKLPFIANVYLETGLGLQDSKIKQIPRSERYLVAKSSNKNLMYFVFGLNHELGKNISIFQAYSHFWLNDLDVYGDQYQKDEIAIKSSINQYYIAPSFRIFKRTTFNPFIHFSSIKTATTSPIPTFNGYNPDPIFNFKTTDTSFFDFSLGGNLFRHTKFGGFSIGLSLNRFGGIGTFQQDIGLIWYPLRSNKLYFKTDIQHLMTKDSVPNARFNFEQTLGFAFSKKLWSELFWVHGNITGSNMNNGFLLYNGLNRQNEMYGLKVSLITAKANFFIRTQFTKFEIDYQKYQQGQISYFSTSNFNKINIIGGFSWKL